MIVVVFVPEAVSLSIAPSPMSRSARCLEYDVLELFLANRSTLTSVPGSRVDRGARQIILVGRIYPASVILLVVGSRACRQ